MTVAEDSEHENTFTSYWTKMPLDWVHDDVESKKWSSSSRLSLGIRGVRQAVMFYLEIEMLESSKTSTSPLSASATGCKLSTSTNSPSTWSLGLKWINECLLKHDKCNRDRSASWKPTRLLEITPTDVGAPQLRLALGRECNQEELYTTLSHCWGKAEMTRLLRENFDCMRASIFLDDLPKTFRDAISVTQKLGIRYIWIDSLCIIQDSVEDWRSEASTMADVYKNFYLNIAATGAPDGSQGCFSVRDPELVRPCSLEFEASGQKYAITIHDRFLWRDQFRPSPLNRRGWVVQERLLAPRVLHYGKNQLFWECREHTACEAYPDGLPSWSFWKLRDANFKDVNIFYDGESNLGMEDPDRLRDVYKSWIGIVDIYARTQLTVPSDKLLALSGIATQFQRRLSDEYVAGMWKSDLIHQLRWSTRAFGFSARQQNYLAPSWSWASVEGPLDLPDYLPDSEPLAAILDFQISLVDNNKTGQVTDGFIHLEGPMTRIFLRDYFLPRAAGLAEPVFPAVKEDKAKAWTFTSEAGGDSWPGDGANMVTFDQQHTVGSIVGADLWAMYLQKSWSERSEATEYDGLVLMRKENRDTKWFQRMGHFVVRLHRSRNLQNLGSVCAVFIA